MIKSLQEINSSLVSLSHQLSNKEVIDQQLKRHITNLLSEVRYLDEKQKSQYYFFISEIYAFKFHNISDAETELKQFDNSLDMEISMNCELRFAIFRYFQQKYKQAFEHLDSGMGYVEQQLKLIDNARFFFHRIINRQYLLTQVKQNNNFEAVFILSLILQGQNQQIQALKQIQAFLNQKDQLFQKFQIYKRLLELYEAMRKNSLSTISISKKSLETYRQELCFLQSKNPQFQENYQFKYRFIMKIITFMKTEDNRNKQKLLKKMLDLKLLAYYKLKKCSKLAPTRQIKMKLQYTAKLIKSSKDSELMESTLNYDFVKQEYDKFKIFYKLTSRDQLLKWKFFTALINYESSSPLKNTQDKQSYKPQSILKNMAPTTMSKSQNVRDPSKSVMNSPNILNSQISRDPSFSVVNTMKNSMKQTAQFVVKHTESQVYMADSQFEGSDMIKIHASSSGNEQRYFYIIPDKINDKPRLYYSNSQKTKSGSDSYYSLKGLKKLQFGKESSAFKRKDTQKFISEQCFTMVFKDEKDRSFYVPDQDSFHRWIVLLQTKVLYSGLNQQNMANTVGFYKKNMKMNSSQSPTMKKSRKHVDI